MEMVSWRSRAAPPPSTMEPPIKGHIMRTRLIEGATPPGRARDRRYTPEQAAAIKQQSDVWQQQGVFHKVTDDSVSVTSALLIVPKYNDERVQVGYRMCGDYRRVNKCVLPDIKFPPRIEDMLERVAEGNLRSKLDCASYYTQFEIDAVSAEWYTVQASRDCVLRPTRAQFGMRNAGSVAQRASEAIFGTQDGVSVYSDEIVRGHTGSLDDSVDELCALLKQAALNNVVLNADKIVILREWIVLMGHEVGPDMVRALPGRLQLLLEWPAPTSIKQTVSFLAAASHYRAFIPAFAQWAGELRAAAIHGKKFEWTAAAQAAFANLRAAFAAAATLQRIRSGEPLYVTTDASAEGVSFAIGQRDELGVLRMVYAGGRSTESYERRYSPMDLEGVAVLTAVNRAPNLLGAGAPVTVLTDSRPLVDFFTKAPQILDPHRAPVRSRIAAALQGFDWAWEHVAGEHNEIMDAASRAAWTPTSGITPSGPTTVAHTLLPPTTTAAPSAPRVAVITPIGAPAEGGTPTIAGEGAGSDDDSINTDDQSDAEEQARVAPVAMGAAVPLVASPWQTPTRISGIEDSIMSAAVRQSRVASDSRPPRRRVSCCRTSAKVAAMATTRQPSARTTWWRARRRCRRRSTACQCQARTKRWRITTRGSGHNGPLSSAPTRRCARSWRRRTAFGRRAGRSRAAHRRSVRTAACSWRSVRSVSNASWRLPSACRS
jgi:hypothetical protein